MKTNNKSRSHMKFSIVIAFIFTISFISIPCNAVLVTGEVNIGTDCNEQQISYPIVRGTLNLYPGAEIYYGMMSQGGCYINFYGGQLIGSSYIVAFDRVPTPVITVYGSNFAVNGQPCDPLATSFMLQLGTFSTLTGFYENGDPINLLFYGNIAINLVGIDSGMEIDIKPGDEENNINLNSQGVIPVAALTTEKFDAITINPLSSRFAGAKPVHWSFEDIDGDGDIDIMFHFRTQELELSEESTEATLTTQLLNTMTMARMVSAAQESSGTIVSGTDKVKIVGAKKSKK